MRRDFRRIISNAADDLGNVMSLKLRITRVDAFGRKGEQEILVELQPGVSNIGSRTSLVVPG